MVKSSYRLYPSTVQIESTQELHCRFSYNGRASIIIFICMFIYMIVDISEHQNVECSKDSLRNSNVNTLSIICTSRQISIDTKCS